MADNTVLSQPADVLPRLPDPKLIRDRVVDALRDATISGRLKPGARQHLLRAHLLRFYENVAPLLPVVSEIADPPANT